MLLNLGGTIGPYLFGAVPRRGYYQQVSTVPNITYLASELLPYLAEVLPEIATDLASKGIEVTATATARSLSSLGVSLSRRFRRVRASSKAHASFERNWQEATTPSQREKAIRTLLSEEPGFAASLDMLLLRRDFVTATASYCNRFPALDQDRVLSNDYVPVSIRPLADTTFITPAFAQPDIAAEGNHIIQGDGGSGKSTFLRYLAWTAAQALLQDRHEVAFDDLRLPCWIRAADLVDSGDVATALHRAVTSSLGGRLRRPLPSDFFVANAVNGHRNWLIFVDGLDEVESPQRRDVWDAIRLHAEQDGGFRFIVATRPEAVVSIPTSSVFSRWTVEPINTAGQAGFAASYIVDLSLRDKFVRLLTLREYRFIGGVPLFLAMSAQLFAKTGELHERKIDLYEHYAANALEKATGADAGKMAFLSELLRIIAENGISAADLVRHHKSLVQALTGSFSALGAEDALSGLLDRTALVRCSSDKYTFSHDLLRSYYRALDLARRYSPGSGTLKEVEPFREGWPVMEQLLLRWDLDDQNVEPVLRSLLEYGEEGLQCAAHVIAAARRQGHSKVAVSVAERFITEAKDSEPTILAHRILAMLAEASVDVRDLLIEELDSAAIISDTFIAECLLDTEEFDVALDHLLWVAGRHDGYPPDRVAAAELLLKHDYREEALEALRDVAENGEEDWTMIDAASILYEQERTPENRQLLADLCAIDENIDPDRIFSSTLARLMGIREAELAIPYLKAAAQLPDEVNALKLGNAIEAARLIAIHQDQLTGKKALEQMLTSCERMREKAEIARALADLGFGQEARSALCSSLDANELEIDWFTIEQLVRLDMADEACSTVEAVVAHLLDGHHGVYEAVNLIEHALPLLDGKAMSAFVLSRARSLREPMLARSVALLGAPEDARSLLSDFLIDNDIDLRIRAAGVLCELGDARLGQSELRVIVRNSDIAVRNRMWAAEKLKSVGLLRHAAFAFARIARDDCVEVFHRTRAAIAFDELEHERNYIVWDPLMALLEDRAQLVADRVEAAQALFRIDGEDGYDDLVYPELFAMLADDELSERDVLRVGASLGARGWKLDEMPRVHRALESNEISLSARIKALQTIGRYGRNQEVVQPLIRIAAHPATSVELALKAVKATGNSDGNSKAQVLLGQISRDAGVPPAWRLKAAKEQRADLRSGSLLFLAQDDSIDIANRVEALETLATGASVEWEVLFNDIANSTELTFWDRRKIAEAADRLKMPALTKSVIQSIKDDRPLSIWEMVELAKLCRELGDGAGAEQVLHELLSLPLVVLISSEDTETVIEGIELAAYLDRELAASRLEQILLSEEIGWWSIADVLETYARLVGRGRALITAVPIIEELSAGLRDSVDEEYSGWPGYAAQLLKRGFYSDYGSLLAFAENEGNRLSERVKACALVISYADAASPFHNVAQGVLSRLLCGELSAKEQIEVAQELHRAGCYPDMNAWLDQCLSNPPEDPKDRRTLAGFLHDLGRTNEARILAESMDASELIKGSLFPIDEALVKSVLEDEVRDDIIFEQLLSNDDPVDQVWRAREYVEEHGDLRALKLILNAAEGAGDDSYCQLDAIECLDQLGFRKISRVLFAAMPKVGIEPYWFGAQLLRFGRKAEAAPFYIESSRAGIEYNENLVWSGLADLGLVTELMESRSGL